MVTSPPVAIVRRGDPARDSPSPVSIHGLRVWDRLRDALYRQGRELIAIEPRDAEREAARGAVLLWDFGSVARLPRGALTKATGRIVAWCLESPLVAHRAFHRLESIVSSSAATLTFEGARDLTSRPAAITPLYYPNAIRPIANDPWSRRDHGVVMIASAKSVRPRLSDIDLRRPYLSARRLCAGALSLTHLRRSQLRIPDLYEKRAAVIRHFSNDPQFRLFGSGWESFSGVDTRVLGNRFCGSVHDKHGVLRRSRFCLCFENTRFPGYITEKIFDCLFAGAIPLYLGAPDVARFVPHEAFIDVAEIGTLARLSEVITGISDRDAEGYREAAREFVRSGEFERFSESRFVATIEHAIRAAS